MTRLGADPSRLKRLEKVFWAFTKGSKRVQSAHDAQIFLEAARARPSAVDCLEAIAANENGLKAVHNCVRMDISAAFASNIIIPFLSFMSCPEANAVYEGKLLQKLIVTIVQPPTFWNAFVDLYMKNGFLNDSNDVKVFAWLCLEIFMHPGPELGVITADLAPILERFPLLVHSNPEIRQLGYRIQKVIQLKGTSVSAVDVESPGGRHDNDFADFRDISIYPTEDELTSNLRPFYRRAAEVDGADPDQKAGVHLDNQFRLLREDMLAELRDDLRQAFSNKRKWRNASVYHDLYPRGLDTGDYHRSRPPSLLVSVGGGLEILRNRSQEQKMSFLADNKRIAPHKGFGVLCKGTNVLGFAFIVRDVQRLCADPPVLGLQFPSAKILDEVFSVLLTPNDIRFIVVDTPVYAYEPILERLKEILELPLEKELLGLPGQQAPFEPAENSAAVINKCLSMQGDACHLEFGDQKFGLDKSQRDALVYALSTPLSLIQGPPGTGKSMLGSMVAHILRQNENSRVLVLSFTNHALDQFLGEITRIGIDPDCIVRLGSKSSDDTAKFSFNLLFNSVQTRRTQGSSALLGMTKAEIEKIRQEIEPLFTKIIRTGTTFLDILEHLEFSDDFTLFWSAFQVPSGDDGFQFAGKNGKTIKGDYLIERWSKGQDAGLASSLIPLDCLPVWGINLDQRTKLLDSWAAAVRKDNLLNLRSLLQEVEEAHKTIERIYAEGRCEFIRTKRVIGCTTTGAAMYSNIIKAAKPDYVLVEEAGEILEAHVLTALHPQTKQLILIGDHKQLRPKVNNYALSVEKGDGYDLNRSLFERLILQGHPVKTLSKQHRMVPEISQLVREMTYPDLLDAESTLTRPDLRGILGRVAFINHDKPEVDVKDLKDRRDVEFTSSKRNEFEARMVLKIVKFLGQQGYGTENIVVLTPYLGQLKLLKEMLSHDTDPLLNDLDNYELIRSGVMTSAASNVGKGRIRLSTIDNYQGEESDIVIASLTRSNNRGDIGFMKAPERLNVLLSRARNCLLLIGNMSTFMASPQGRHVWVPFMDLLKSKQCLQDGLWVACEQHPEKRLMLQSPQDFETKCPDGGCSDPCLTKLSCGVHRCQRQCHRIVDHGSTQCDKAVEKTCDERHHSYTVPCHEQNSRCPKCLREEEDIRRRAKRDLDLEKKCLAQQAAYREQLRKIQDEIGREKRLAKEKKEEEERKKILDKYQSELNMLTKTRERMEAINHFEKSIKFTSSKLVENAQTKTGQMSTASKGDSVEPESAKADWEHQKQSEHAESTPLDMLMEMIGLEEVKQEFLKIKSTVDTAVRQGISPRNERYSCVFLGNPGTGKTTVARIYAQFITSMGLIPGQMFEETTGSKLANAGVNGCQKLLEDMQNRGGGVLFIDEAYQLSSGNSPGGAAVLDFLLAEVENLRGKIIFVLAGYAKQMETFFAHNPGFPSRFPTEIKFSDYTDKELLKILAYNIEKRWANAMMVEGGLQGLYCRIACGRVGRGRGREGFGNARAVENLFQTIRRRQAHRLKRSRRAKLPADDMTITKEDLIGPEPSDALLKSDAWKKLQKMIGLSSVKESLKAFVDTLKENYQRELREEPIIEYSLNRVFLGNPGTGKTTIAKLYGQILVDLGMLSNGEVVVKNPSDFVASVIGGSQKQTKGILAATVGKVLVIDEAYGLYSGGGASSSSGFNDSYKSDVIDTIVAEVQSVPGDDRCVLLLGYKDQMEEMFQNVNPGLSRRFPMAASGFNFEDFTAAEMNKILQLKLDSQAYKITDEARRVALEMLERARNRPNYGNAGEINILLNDAKARHQKRRSAGKNSKAGTLEAYDFDEDFDRAERSETNIQKLFDGTIGCEKIVATLRGYQETARHLRQLGMDPKDEIPFTFLFRGPPGTGKTMTAKRMAKVFYDAGFLSDTVLINSSASDLVGQYVGQTGPKVRELLDKALGRVLLIDEAYRLADGQFAKEALDELVDALTKERYHKKFIVILAGYEDDINRLLGANPGLTSRFPEVVDFHSLPPDRCFELLAKLLLKRNTMLKEKGTGSVKLDCLETPSSAFFKEVTCLFEKLSEQFSWASARDVETIAKDVFKAGIRKAKRKLGQSLIFITEGMVRHELVRMLREREARSNPSHPPGSQKRTAQPPTCQSSAPTHRPSVTATAQNQHIQQDDSSDNPRSPPSPVPASSPSPLPSRRDAGVSDAVWEQLLKDAAAEARKEEEYRQKLKVRQSTDDTLREKIVKELLEEEERRKKVAEAKKKLEMRGLCPAKFVWIHQAGGYRCAGGSHWVSDQQMSNM